MEHDSTCLEQRLNFLGRPGTQATWVFATAAFVLQAALSQRTGSLE
jgi:hypothetical protein